MIQKLRFLFLLTCTMTAAQDILWEHSYGGKQAEYLFDLQPTPDYGFILAGSSLSKKTGSKTEDNKGDLDYWIWKMDEKGAMEWQKSFGGNGSDFLQSLRLTPDGGYILGGTSTSGKDLDKKDEGRGGNDYWFIKLNAKGNEEWQQTFGGDGQDDLLSIVPSRNGGYLITGSSSSAASGDKTAKHHGNMDYWLLQLDSKGKVLWQQSYGGDYADLLRSVEATQDGGYILGGYSNSTQSGDKSSSNYGEGGDYWVIKIDAKGSIEWQQTLGGDKDDQLYALHQTADHGYIVAGSSNSGLTNNKNKANRSGTDFWVLQLNTLGNIVWQETYDFGKYDILTSLVENDDHSFLIGGHAQSEGKKGKDPEAVNDYIALKISPTGEKLWEKTIGSSGEDILKKVVETRDGGYVMAGTSDGKVSRDKNSGVGNKDFWVVKLKDKSKPETQKLSIEALPNPAITFTNIIVGYDFTDGTASVHDLAGRQLQWFPIKTRTVPIDLSGLPEGIYIVNIDTNVQHDGIKVIKGLNKN